MDDAAGRAPRVEGPSGPGDDASDRWGESPPIPICCGASRTVARADADHDEKIPRLTVRGMRHTFAAISLSKAEADLLSMSQAMGHARPSITLDRYGHPSKKGLTPLMSRIDALVAPPAKAT